eukprot:m.494062 g.494062  ORF g.494062 m.494062 type:complete len:304 (-) comp57288_c0_seq3:1358-2269(-)
MEEELLATDDERLHQLQYEHEHLVSQKRELEQYMTQMESEVDTREQEIARLERAKERVEGDLRVSHRALELSRDEVQVMQQEVSELQARLARREAMRSICEVCKRRAEQQEQEDEAALAAARTVTEPYINPAQSIDPDTQAMIEKLQETVQKQINEIVQSRRRITEEIQARQELQDELDHVQFQLASQRSASPSAAEVLPLSDQIPRERGMTFEEQRAILAQYMEERQVSSQLREELIRVKIHVGESYNKFRKINSYIESRDAHLIKLIERRCSKKVAVELLPMITASRLDLLPLMPILDMND